MNEPKVLLIVGPTAVGKTELSLTLAEHLHGEILSSDSRQVYRFMDIGTAKPTADELQRVPHHFIDIRTPDQYYSAGEYGREARAKVDELLQRNVLPIVVGGSGFYIQALVDGLFAPKHSDLQVKEKWRRLYEEKGREYVFNYLKSVDPASAERLHMNDSQRVVRALEVWELAGKPISDFRKGEEEAAAFQPVFIGLNRDRNVLYQRINQRVEMMLEQGLLAEVQHLAEMGYDEKYNALRTVGYQEVFAYFAGEYSKLEMIEKIKQNSRRYAKRQLTWFRKNERIHWLNLDENDIDASGAFIKDCIKKSRL